MICSSIVPDVHVDPHDHQAALELIAGRFRLTADELRHGRSTKFRSTVRRLAALLLRETGLYSLADVARILEYGDHSGVYAAIKWTRARLEADRRLAATADELRLQLGILPREEGS